jgi:hypothetical protein
MASDLVKRYTDYRIKNEQIKARQRREREKELLPFLIDIGRAVDEDRSNGHSVPELAGLISNKNRNFLYGAMRAYKATLPEQVELDIPELSRFEAEPTVDQIDVGDFAATVYAKYDTGRDEDIFAFDFKLDSGTVVDYPEGIAERYGKPFLKKLIAEVEREAATDV